jgi:NitT/TauT family transport system ATP-binding protein
VAAPAPPLIEVTDVGRTFADGTRALAGASLTVPAGAITALVGPSGCGKTTLLRMMGGLDAPTSGAVSFAGGARPRAAFAFQEPRLLPWRSVLSNVALPLELAGVPRGERRARAERILDRVQLAGAGRKLPGQLSGGMRMRASIARALVTEPELLLLDEPFGALDEITRQALDDLLLSLWGELGMTVVVVTHSIVEAAYLGRQVVVMAPAPGRVVGCIEPGFASRTPALRATPEFAAATASLLQMLAQSMVREKGAA